jgi:hypothetical protein
MDDSFQPVNLHCFVKGSLLRDIFDDAEIQFRRWDIRVRSFDLLYFLLGADGRHDGMATLEEDIENVCCYEAATTYVAC